MKAEHLQVGDRVYLLGINSQTFRIDAILPPLIYPNYLEFHLDFLKEAIYVPMDRELTLIGSIPVIV
jgi:hypothetical protein